MRSNASWVMVTWDPPPSFEQTDACDNITFPQLHLRTVNIIYLDTLSFEFASEGCGKSGLSCETQYVSKLDVDTKTRVGN